MKSAIHSSALVIIKGCPFRPSALYQGVWAGRTAEHHVAAGMWRLVASVQLYRLFQNRKNYGRS